MKTLNVEELTKLALKFVAIAALAFSAGITAHRLINTRSVADVPNEDAAYFERVGITPGRQLSIVFLGGSGCKSCSRGSIVKALSRLREAIRDSSFYEYNAVRVVAVAINTDQELADQFLGRFPRDVFDEIMVGGGWHSELLLHLNGTFGIRSNAPKLVLLSRTLSIDSSTFELVVGRDSLLGVLNGATQIEEWSDLQFDTRQTKSARK